ncbi:nitroreductase family protein [Clostridium sp. KNHs205]|jgi:nitroreductase|uniref:nitroreductase family protein n=1 Tax=Clostridium sp. KNHs205 TaxID=1449050 RepID=UPI000A63F0E3|nr:nitroreductase family protein [Clostridium sp. KNHs205]
MKGQAIKMREQFNELVTGARTVRRFEEEKEITLEQLKALADLGRLSPSGANLQPLKYILVSSKESREKVFPCLSWAGYLKEWEGPVKGERPGGYIILLRDKNIAGKAGMDEGIAAQSIFLGAAYQGIKGCFIGSVKREILAKELEISEEYEISLVIALGYPKEEVVVEEIREGNVKYWRDEKGVHHVPKRPLEEVIVKSF